MAPQVRKTTARAEECWSDLWELRSGRPRPDRESCSNDLDCCVLEWLLFVCVCVEALSHRSNP